MGADPYNLYDLAHVSRVGPVLGRFCTSSDDGKTGEELNDLPVDNDLSYGSCEIFADTSSHASTGTIDCFIAIQRLLIRLTTLERTDESETRASPILRGVHNHGYSRTFPVFVF